jgi:hypothetical protein
MTTTETATAERIADQLLTNLQAKGIKPSKACISGLKLLRQLTRAELIELRDWIVRHELMDPNTAPELRRELLSRFEKCPCCDRWLGHNNPPADGGEPEPTYRRQPAFNFGPKPKG